MFLCVWCIPSAYEPTPDLPPLRSSADDDAAHDMDAPADISPMCSSSAVKLEPDLETLIGGDWDLLTVEIGADDIWELSKSEDAATSIMSGGGSVTLFTVFVMAAGRIERSGGGLDTGLGAPACDSN